ncbi:F-box WD repeat-containing 7, partial [Brachionus plicatilis]
IWNKDNGECMQTLSGHSDMIKGLKVVNTNILSVSKDKHIYVWRTDSESFVKKVRSTESITCLAVLENGDLMTGSIEGFIRTWNIESSNFIDEFRAHDKSVYCILFLTPNMFVSCSADKTIKLWSLGSKNCRKIFDGHTEYVWCLEKVSDKKFLSGSKDAKIFLWNIEKTNYEIVFQAHKDIVRCIRMKNDEEFLSCSADGSVIEWNLSSSKQKQSLDLPGKIPINAIFITDENELVIALKDGTLQLWSSNFY